MDLVTALFGIIAALVGGLFYVNQKRKSAEALNENLGTKEEILAKQREIAEKEALAAAEAAKRKDLDDKFKKENHDVSIEELKDFFNKPNGS